MNKTLYTLFFLFPVLTGASKPCNDSILNSTLGYVSLNTGCYFIRVGNEIGNPSTPKFTGDLSYTIPLVNSNWYMSGLINYLNGKIDLSNFESQYLQPSGTQSVITSSSNYFELTGLIGYGRPFKFKRATFEFSIMAGLIDIGSPNLNFLTPVYFFPQGAHYPTTGGPFAVNFAGLSKIYLAYCPLLKFIYTFNNKWGLVLTAYFVGASRLEYDENTLPNYEVNSEVLLKYLANKRIYFTLSSEYTFSSIQAVSNYSVNSTSQPQFAYAIGISAFNIMAGIGIKLGK